MKNEVKISFVICLFSFYFRVLHVFHGRILLYLYQTHYMVNLILLLKIFYFCMRFCMDGQLVIVRR